MEQRAEVSAAMMDGAILVERVDGFWRFVDVVLGFRADPDCRRVTWVVRRERTAGAPSIAAAAGRD